MYILRGHFGSSSGSTHSLTLSVATSCMASGNASQLAETPEGITQDAAQLHASAHQTHGNSYQIPPYAWSRILAYAGIIMPYHVLTIRQREAERRPPRRLHKLARDALNCISNMHAHLHPVTTVDLDNWFPWVQYVAAHRQNFAIIGPGILHGCAEFLSDTNDPNRGGAPRLDFWFYRTDGTVCRVHPGNKPKQDAALLFEDF